jgi:formylglycine-generating enzyme required for sulfatase activity
MAGQVRVFVSHHHSPEEDAFTARLVADLEAAGADVWVDNARITSDDFIKKINEGLTGRQWLVLVMTPDALRSPWVQAEVNAALLQVRQGRMMGVIPLVAQPCNEADIPPLWATLQYYDTMRGYDTARGGLFSALGLTPGRSAPPVQPAPPTYAAPPDRFPPRLAELGYRVVFLNSAEVILPPMCDVPAGPFLMGSDPAKDNNARPSEQPQHWVTLGAFQIGQYPVTVAEYACFIRATGRTAPTGTDGEGYQMTWQTQLHQRSDHPVVMVNWQEAMSYAQWLAKRTSQPWRLPSEAEWEKAARWDPPTGTARLYPWGDAFDVAHCNMKLGKKEMMTPVGSYPSGTSPYGAQDMAGNVWEWTGTLYASYPYKASDGREQAESTGHRVLRGGSWVDDAGAVRAAHRIGVPADFAFSDIGFRLARSVPNS